MVEFCVVRWLDDHDDNGDFFITINDLPEGDLSYTMISLHQVLRRKIFESSYIYLPATQPLSVPTPFEIMKIQGFKKLKNWYVNFSFRFTSWPNAAQGGLILITRPLNLSATQPLSLSAYQLPSLSVAQPLNLSANPCRGVGVSAGAIAIPQFYAVLLCDC